MFTNYHAESGEDFSSDPSLNVTFLPTPVAMSPFTTTACTWISLINDNVVEDSEEFMVEVGAVDCEVFPYFSISPPARMIIIDDDG